MSHPVKYILWLMVASWVGLGYFNWTAHRDMQKADAERAITLQEVRARSDRMMWEAQREQIERSQSQEQNRVNQTLAIRALEWDIPLPADVPRTLITLTHPLPFVLPTPAVSGEDCGCCS